MRTPSVRIRVATAFTAAMLVVLAVIGGFVYVRTAHALDRATSESLTARLDDARAIVSGAPDLAAVAALEFADRDETFVQVVDHTGRALSDSGDTESIGAFLSPDVLAAAIRGTVDIEARVERGDPVSRLRLARTELDDGSVVIVAVGASLGPRTDTLEALGSFLLLGGAIGIALTAVIGYLAVALSLRPVERMRRQAAEITPAEVGRRLHVSESGDELSRLATTINDMLARLDHGIQRERRLTADASHELRTPLTLLKMELEIAVSESASPTVDAAATIERLRATIRSSEAEVDRLIQLSESLLLLARSDQAELAIVRSSTDVGHLLEELRLRYARRSDQESRSMFVDAVDARMDLDPIRLAQALGNLVDNAFRHGRGAVTIHAHVEPTGDLVFLVTDEGTGIAPDFRADAFDRFTREEVSRTSRGAGLGLAIVRAIAEAHGGTASIVDRDGSGFVELRVPA